MRRTAVIVAVAATVMGVAACGGGDDEAEPSGESRQTFEIAATDFAFDPANVEVDEAGVYTFRLVNDGESQHALEVEGAGTEVETETIGPGETAEVKVELAAGEYELYCPVGNHKELGMEGTVVVGGGGAGGGTTTGDAGTEDNGGLDY